MLGGFRDNEGMKKRKVVEVLLRGKKKNALRAYLINYLESKS